jgi:hypothetical protein
MFNKDISSRDELIKVIDALELLGKGYTITSGKMVVEDPHYPRSFGVWRVVENGGNKHD